MSYVFAGFIIVFGTFAGYGAYIINRTKQLQGRQSITKKATSPVERSATSYLSGSSAPNAQSGAGK